MQEAQKYLGIGSERLSVVAPALSLDYSSADAVIEDALEPAPYLFGIAGSHKSKNPVAALGIYRGLVDDGVCDVRINAPKLDQFGLLAQLGSLAGIELSHSISDERKFDLQRHAAAVAHLSLEEGFGIPLLEAVFLGRKVLVLDVPINREILGRTKTHSDGNVLWLQPGVNHVDPDRMRAFLQLRRDPSFYSDIRGFYLAHWRESIDILACALSEACRQSRRWMESLSFKVFSSVPGSFCGVADYSVAYARSATGNVAYFYSSGSQEYISYLPNVRAVAAGEFSAFTAQQPSVQGLYNFAFSDELYPGVKLAFEHATARDAILIHERAYLPGLWRFMENDAALDELTLDLPSGSAEAASAYARDLATSSLFSPRHPRPESGQRASRRTGLDVCRPSSCRICRHLSCARCGLPPRSAGRFATTWTPSSPVSTTFRSGSIRVTAPPLGASPPLSGSGAVFSRMIS